MAIKDTLPLLPLPIAIIPGQIISLRVPEEPFGNLIDQCQANPDQHFGINYSSGLGMASIGCSLSLQKILKTYKDGSIEIIAKGERRYKLEEIVEDEILKTAKIKYFKESLRPRLDKQVLSRFIDLHSEMSVVVGVKSVLNPREGRISYRSACDIGLEDLQRQALLELQGEKDRIIWLSDIYNSILSEVKGSKQSNKLALPEDFLIH